MRAGLSVKQTCSWYRRLYRPSTSISRDVGAKGWRSFLHHSTSNSPVVPNPQIASVKINLTDHDHTSNDPSEIKLMQKTADIVRGLEEYSGNEDLYLLDKGSNDTEILTMSPKESSTTKPSSSLKQRREKLFFEEHFQNSVEMFSNYIQACLFSGHLKQALNTLEVRIKSIKEPSPSVPSSKIALEPLIYNLVLSRLAAISPSAQISCNFVEHAARPLDIIRKIFGEMRSLHLKPSLSAYASALEAMDKCPDQNVRIALCLQEIQDDGYTLDEVIGTCCPGSKSAIHVRQAIMQVAMYNQYNPQISVQTASAEDINELPSLVRGLYSSKDSKPGALHLSTFSKLHQSYGTQMQLERSGILKVDNILKSELPPKILEEKKNQLSELLNEWRVSLLKGFQDLKKIEKAQCLTAHGDWRSHFAAGAGGKVYPFLCLLPEQEYVEIIINHLCSTINGGDFTSMVCCKLGEEVYAKFAMHRMKDAGIMPRLQQVYKEYGKYFTDSELQASTSPRQLWVDLEEKYGLTYLEEKLIPWNSYWIFSVGMKLVEIMHLVSFVPRTSGDKKLTSRVSMARGVPAVYNSYVFQAKRQFGMTIPHPQFRLLLKNALGKLLFEVKVAPMVVPPRPWCGVFRGGLLANQVTFMRCNTIDESLDPERTLDEAKLGSIYDSLNILGSVAWRINKPILDLQLKYFRNNGSKKLSIPQPPSMLSQPMPDLSSTLQDDAKVSWEARRMAIEILKERKEMYGLYMDALYKFSIANEYRDKTIWFAHNIDFRGRFYPVAKYFNYMGSDVYRSLFLFAEGRVLGERGLEWLKLHCINLTDFKKHSSLAERLDYSNEVLDRIIASADDPDAEDAWWKSSDKPWQTLAVCFEIAAALRSPDPAKFVSRLPVHQDGSCNGLQHYAALGRDVLGAQQVNLAPSVTPQDVYIGVARKAEALRKIDASRGVKIAKQLDGFVQRKMVKQTVMTTVYGVTRYGGMHQIGRQLKRLEDDFPKTECMKGASYLIDKVFESITEMFSGAKNIQTWLTQLADVVSKMGHAVDWTTPLNLVVTQPYYKEANKYISSSVQRISLVESVKAVPNPSKQRNGFPPNFVHSLDSTHMMLTALHCCKEGVSFASVHDCFWTHASTIDVMGKICRQQFIALHSEPILDNLANHLRKHLPRRYDPELLTPLERRLDHLLSNVPKRGEFDLNEVMDSTFFFS